MDGRSTVKTVAALVDSMIVLLFTGPDYCSPQTLNILSELTTKPQRELLFLFLEAKYYHLFAIDL